MALFLSTVFALAGTATSRARVPIPMKDRYLLIIVCSPFNLANASLNNTAFICPIKTVIMSRLFYLLHRQLLIDRCQRGSPRHVGFRLYVQRTMHVFHTRLGIA